MAEIGSGEVSKNSEHPVVSLHWEDMGNWSLWWGKKQFLILSSSFLLPRKLCQRPPECSSGSSQGMFLMANQYKLPTTALTPLLLCWWDSAQREAHLSSPNLSAAALHTHRDSISTESEGSSLAWLCGTLGKRTCCCTENFVLWSSEHFCLWYS